MNDPDWAKALGFDNEDDEDNANNLDEAVRVRPVNLTEYKDHCKKKVKKGWNKRAQISHDEAEATKLSEEELELALSSPKGASAGKVPFTSTASFSKENSNNNNNNNSSSSNNYNNSVSLKEDSNPKDNGLTPRQPESTNAASASNPRNKKK